MVGPSPLSCPTPSGIAQLAEQRTVNPRVAGSSPAPGAIVDGPPSGGPFVVAAGRCGRGAGAAGHGRLARTLDDEHPERWIEVDGRRWRTSDPSIPAGAASRARRRADVGSACGRCRLPRRRRGGGARRQGAGAGRQGGARRARPAVVGAARRGGPPGAGWRLPCARWPATGRPRARPVRRTRRGRSAVHRGATDMDVVRDVVREEVRQGPCASSRRGRPVDPERPWHGPVRVRMTASADDHAGGAATARSP